MMRTVLAVLLSVCGMSAIVLGCSGDEPDLAGCADPAHDGLACAAYARPEQIGVCASGACVPLACEVDDDCNDRAGHDACRSMTCEKAPEQFTGSCKVTPIAEGSDCAHPAGWIGVC